MALVFHVVVAGIADGAMASAQVAGIFYAPICSSHGGTETPRSPGQPDQPHLPDCCLSWCSVATGSVLIATVPTILPSRAHEPVDLPLPAYHRPVQRLDRPSLNPRAPPAIA
jgi:hypothetical protein